MARNYNKGRLYHNRSDVARFLTDEEILACEIHIILNRPMTVAAKHAFRLNVKPISLPAIASRIFGQPHLKRYVDYLRMEVESTSWRW